jgi:hypothetical protein
MVLQLLAGRGLVTVAVTQSLMADISWDWWWGKF